MLKNHRISFYILFLSILVGVITFSCTRTSNRANHKVLILGIDGMDYKLLSRYMSEGKMPNFSKLAQNDGFRPLLSSIPPQSPVAWANFITGMNPGGHGIFDFIHRKPEETILPYLSTTETLPPARFLHLGKYQFPLKGGKIVLKRYGDAFWQIISRKGIPSIIYKIPANFPPAECKLCKEVAGMGTPDLLGTYGTFSYFTDNPPPNASKVTGGKVFTVWVENNTVHTELIGPPNTFLNEPADTAIPFTVYTDPKANAAMIEIEGSKILLKVGEWSGWVKVSFNLAPLVPKMGGMVRFYLKELKPDFKLYVSPINVDPQNPALPISSPASYASNLARDMGLFYTAGMPEDTKSLQHDVLNDHEYAAQALSIFDESKRNFWHIFNGWRDGLLFYYFSSLDQNQHTFWRAQDPESPLYSEQLNREFGDFIEKLYIEMDTLLGKVVEKLDGDTTLIIMSDHGFASYRREFNLNTWLLDNGYIALNDPSARDKVEFLQGVDWSRTKAYNIGINSLYINLRGREANGIVDPAEADRLIEEIKQKLEAAVDPKTGKRVVKNAYIAKKVYTGDHANEAPDIIVGYDLGYRGSDSSALGEFHESILEDNTGKWSGDHCIDPLVVPGVLLSNRKIKMSDPHLYDLTPTILQEYGIQAPANMVGRPVW